MGMTHTMVFKRPADLAYAATVAATSLGFVVVQLDVSIVNVALNRIGSALSMGIGGLQWVVDAYTLAFASLLLAGGALGDRIGAAAFSSAAWRCSASPRWSVAWRKVLGC